MILGFAESLHHAKQKAQTKLYCQTIVLEGHKIILRHLICQIRNALHFLDFASWCKDSAIPSKLLDKSFPADFCHYFSYLNNFTYPNTIQNSEDKAVPITKV